MSNFYVYAHFVPGESTPFYVGKGRNGRAHSKKGRSKYWHRIVQKYGFVVELLVTNLEEPDAFIQEILAIKEFSPRCNFTKGGQGVSGFKQPKELIERRIKRGENHYRWGKTISPELVKKMHDALKLLNLPNNKAVRVQCTVTGKIWQDIGSCAKEIGIKPTTLRAKLRGQSRNNTSITRVESTGVN